MPTLIELIEMVRLANPAREAITIRKRFYKMLEELGEISEASNNLTGIFNGKGITWADLREEIVDNLILAIDIALTPVAGNSDGVPIHAYTDVFPRAIFNSVRFEEESFEDSVFKINKAVCTAREAITDPQYVSTYFRAIYEILSVSIVITYTRLPGDENLTFEDYQAVLMAEMERKLDKWAAKRERMRQETGRDTDAL